MADGMREAVYYYCQGGGGQWDVKVRVVQVIPCTMLRVVASLESGTLSGVLGSDGHMYAIAPLCDLFDKPQGDGNDRMH